MTINNLNLNLKVQNKRLFFLPDPIVPFKYISYPESHNKISSTERIKNSKIKSAQNLFYCRLFILLKKRASLYKNVKTYLVFFFVLFFLRHRRLNLFAKYEQNRWLRPVILNLHESECGPPC